MLKKILLNNTEFHFTQSDLPCVIHGADHAGASLFTVTMMADLYRQGEKIVFVSGYHMARDEFLTQTNAEDEIIYLKKEEQVKYAKEKNVIFIQKDNLDLFPPLIKSLPELGERVILIKNIDVFDESIFKIVKDCSKLIISGDIDRCPFKEEILKINFKTKIFFSIPQTNFNVNLPPLLKYQGYLYGENENGEVKIGTED